ncbi:maleylpyruvate isomerase family mycothiol-dependent enzyme [Microlunatus speluncae]|uniref:maleylpyruvate isomerase family mycothiol-dependent enzyme n=1 Tax=Microlunatus speluncae TaxID=2594267 RepID=UPI0012664495|nr:maleylpyruvate isomerase family mycothiol-dependent enzyme [Microlunatus speluncae]
MTKLKTAEVWAIVHAERRALVRDLADLTAEQWETRSLCPDWTVHDVVAHLVDSAKVGRLDFIRRMITSRFDFDRDNANGVARERRDRPEDTLAALAATVELTRTPPADPATRLVEAFGHGEDIRRPLGLTGSYPATGIGAALNYLARTGVAVGGGKERVSGLRIQATDLDWSTGSGPDLRGRGIDLLLALSGRPAGAAELSGAGLETLTASFSA